MLIFEVISAILSEKSSRKYKCTSGPRKGQRVAKISTCSAPIKHRSGSYQDNDEQEPRKYVPKNKKNKKIEKKKLKPKRANIHSESQLHEYGGTGGTTGNAKVTKVIPGKEVTVKNDKDGTETKYDLKKNPQALTKNEKGVTVNPTTEPGQKPNPATIIKPGDKVSQKK